jgi:hypothetical protein
MSAWRHDIRHGLRNLSSYAFHVFVVNTFSVVWWIVVPRVVMTEWRRLGLSLPCLITRSPPYTHLHFHHHDSALDCSQITFSNCYTCIYDNIGQSSISMGDKLTEHHILGHLWSMLPLINVGQKWPWCHALRRPYNNFPDSDLSQSSTHLNSPESIHTMDNYWIWLWLLYYATFYLNWTFCGLNI